MSEPESSDLPATVEGEVVESPRAFEPSPIALMSEDEFLLRVELAKLEKKRLQTLKKEVLTPGVDYGTIPGTEKKGLNGEKLPNDSIYQPGVQQLNLLYGYRARLHYCREVGDGITAPPIGYVVDCDILDSNGFIRASGLGSANSWEKKHRYRYANRTCPHCQNDSIIPAKNFDTGKAEGYVCWKKRGGCNRKFKTDEEIEGIESQPLMSENPDPHDLDNTLLKMAAKRATAAATVAAHAASGLFSQDGEDGTIPPDAESRAATNHQGGTTTTAPRGRAPDEGAPDEGFASSAQVTLMRGKTKARLADLGKPEGLAGDLEAYVAGIFSVQNYDQIPKAHVTEALNEIETATVDGNG